MNWSKVEYCASKGLEYHHIFDVMKMKTRFKHKEMIIYNILQPLMVKWHHVTDGQMCWEIKGSRHVWYLPCFLFKHR